MTRIPQINQAAASTATTVVQLHSTLPSDVRSIATQAQFQAK